MKFAKIFLISILSFFLFFSAINYTSAATVSDSVTVTVLPPPVVYSLTISKTGTGSGTVTGAGTYNSGTVVNMTAVASSGSVFAGWSGNSDCTDGSVTMNASKSCTATFNISAVTPPPSTPTLSANAGSCGTGTIYTSWTTSAGATAYILFDSSSGGSPIYTGPSTNFTHSGLTAGSSHSYTVAAQGPGGTSSYSSSVVRTAPAVCITYPLTISKTGTGSGTVTGAGTYNSGTVVNMTAVASSGSVFAGWSGNSDCTDGSVTMNASKSCTATFNASAVIYNNLNVSVVGSGTVSSSPSGITCPNDCFESYLSTTSVTLSATPINGASFTGWSGSSCSGTGSCTVSMNSARSVTANFTAGLTMNVSISASPNPTSIGSSTLNWSATSNSALPITCTAIPMGFPAPTDWSGTKSASGFQGVSVSQALTYGLVCTNGVVGASNDVTITTAAPQYSLTISKTGTGSGTVTGAGTYNSGTVVNMTAVASSGSVFAGWSGNSDCTDGSVTMNASKSCTATFDASSATSGWITGNNPCYVPEGQSSCTLNFSWGTINPTSWTSIVRSCAALYCPTIGNALNGSGTYSIPQGTSATLFLRHDGEDIWNQPFTAICTSGTSWDGSKCAAIVTNTPPTAPTITANSSNFYKNVLETFNFRSTDPDGDQIRYYIDWNGDYTADEATAAYNSGYTYSSSHSWPSIGTYNIHAKSFDNTTGSISAWTTYTINVVELPLAPTLTLSANPTSVAYNDTTSLTWTSSGATSCSLTGGGVSETGLSGSNVVTPPLTTNTTFTLSCTGAGGTTVRTEDVTVSGFKPIFKEI